MNRDPRSERAAYWRRDHQPAATTARRDATRARLAARYRRVRTVTEQLMAPLFPDDFRIQTMPEVSPPYWNLGHTSWFFAANVLQRHDRMPAGFDGMDYALNSYYEGLGARLPRELRGRVASPSTEAVRDYRRAVDDAMLAWIDACPDEGLDELHRLLAIGVEHEQQHQELFVTEILHIRWSAPDELRRGYLQDMRSMAAGPIVDPGPMRAVGFDATTTTIGHQGRSIDGGDFCWDNELPAHRVHVGDFALADRLVSNAEWIAFVEDGGYRDPLLWLQNGWEWVQRERIEAPLYWQRDDRGWSRFSLYGMWRIAPHAPVCHVSFYEADAFARWFGQQSRDWQHARLPRESEWEHAARRTGFDTARGNLLDDDLARCAFDVSGSARPAAGELRDVCGTAWEWTQSHYEAYPGYRPFDGALTEYNGKFMDNQRVLRGGSFATPRSAARVEGRNFWAPTTRFQVSSVRLLREG